MPIDRRKSRLKREMVCKCDCGNVVNITVANLVSGNSKSCGCLAKELAHKKSINNVIGKKFGRLTVIKEADDSSNGYTKVLCQCECGNIKSIHLGDILSGMTKSCGCFRKEKAKKQYTEDLTGMVFNELTAIRQVDNHIGNTGTNRVQWLFKCSCGREVIAMPMNVKRGMTKSCGHIGNSYAEHKIFNFLSKNNIPFKYNICPFDDLVNPETNHKLYLDFVISKPDGTKIVIEHQGEQHFYTKGARAKNNFGKLQREITDDIKRKYFIDHDIQFYETRYDDNYIQSIKAILKSNGFEIEEEEADNG